MKRQQVFVRAQDETGKWFSCDVLDLDDDSFRAFVADMLFRAGIVHGVRDEAVEGERITYRARPCVLRKEE